MTTGPTRVAGSGRLADGSVVTWTVADGRRGRRWREVIARGTAVVHSLLLETDPDGRFSHLELARADGLWTFHPESDDTLHGNHVGSGANVVHLAGRPFTPDGLLIVEGSVICLAAITRHRASTIAIGGNETASGVAIEIDGSLTDRAIRIERLSATRWLVGEGSPIEIDEAGLPVLDEGVTRPLELD